VNGEKIFVSDDGSSLLEVLREQLGYRSVKDGCSPQGQCGCCTVWVDGAPRVACVTSARRVAGREVTTLEGLAPAVRDAWAQAFADTGASQCGFCTPGIIMRLAALQASRPTFDEAAVKNALLAHLCRCTGWRTILEAARRVASEELGSSVVSSADSCTCSQRNERELARPLRARDLQAARARAALEGGLPQTVGPEVALGAGGFADDTAPAGALLAVPDGRGGFCVAESLAAARAMAGKVQGRNTTVALRHPLEVAPGDWLLTLRTTFVEPAYLEPDASWCAPGGEPASSLANGGAFGGKLASSVAGAARSLAAAHGRPVRVLFAREDVVCLGSKRPPVAAALREDGRGVIRVARTPGSDDLSTWADAVHLALPHVEVEEVEVPGPRVSAELRAAGWAEAAVLGAALDARCEQRVGTGHPLTVVSPGNARATATIDADGAVSVRMSAGEVLDEVVLCSYAVGAAHQALGWVRSEGVAVAEDGEVLDLTIRSFGILSAKDMPRVDVEIEKEDAPAVRGSDAVFAAVAAAAWLAGGLEPAWPLERSRRGSAKGGGI
jgi:aerobic-type carbon monoxide dehydrogenase small subunit (CoxS/CutS family)